MQKSLPLFVLLVVAAAAVGGYMVTAPDRPAPPYFVASLD